MSIERQRRANVESAPYGFGDDAAVREIGDATPTPGDSQVMLKVQSTINKIRASADAAIQQAVQQGNRAVERTNKEATKKEIQQEDKVMGLRKWAQMEVTNAGAKTKAAQTQATAEVRRHEQALSISKKV